MMGLVTLPVRVETDLAAGLPAFSIVGLPDAAVREARDRVRAAIHNSGFEFPQRRITVNLAPADLPKESGRFDLPIALGILAASDQIPRQKLAQWEFVGELSLSGALLPVRGAFALVMGSAETGSSRRLMLPMTNQEEASLTQQEQLGFAHDLRQVADFLSGRQPIGSPQLVDASALGKPSAAEWSAIKGQHQAKRAAVIAIAGRHNLLMFGPPGVGKSFIASKMARLLPLLSCDQARSLARIVSLTDAITPAQWRYPPFRSPHHTTPARALIGGGQPLRAGEVSLAHHGILFLDELPEFSRDALESLREPLETQEVHIVRVKEKMRLPADFMLVAAMNPCPCGNYGVLRGARPCRCTTDRILRYRAKISSPLLDRFDLVVGLEVPAQQDFLSQTTSHQSVGVDDDIFRQIEMAREIQMTRQGKLNSRCSGLEIERFAQCESLAASMLTAAAKRYEWSLRSWHRIHRVARTIADLDGSPTVLAAHVSEAIALRRALELENATARTNSLQWSEQPARG